MPSSQAAEATQTGMEIITRPSSMMQAYLESSIDWDRLPPHLADAARYGTLGGGKRIRPVLVILSCEAAGGRAEDALPAAAALELVHCFSLVHDDLPALDNDVLRRGQPTLHVHAGEPMAILAGDLLLAMAFGELARMDMAANRVTALVDELASGTRDMVVGQVYDTLGGLPTDIEALEQIQLVHRNKTGALLRAACRMGAICAGAADAEIAALTTYGEAVGLMFQVVDDLLDVTQSTEHVGKATGKDSALGKRTYPGLLGVEGSQAVIDQLHQQAVAALEPLDSAGEPLRDLCRYMAIRTR
ncbi:MAG: polyprenyl synthetase family protein [Phycisphaerales bacterium]|nr:polyprenyl synthetase family protein [Phycisphaerales bacterium]